MAIEFLCKTCSTTLRVPDEHAGKQAKCPKCETLNVIQAGSIQPPGHSQFDSGQMPMGIPTAPQKPGASPFAENPFAASNVMPAGGVAGRAYQAAHRGSMVLTLGIFALVCNFALIPGILAWVLGRSDMKEIDAGRMDAEGRGMTQAGMILGIIGTIIPLVIIMIYVAFIVIALIFAAAAAGGAGGGF